MELDKKDKRLLYWLDKDARMTKKQLGRKIQLSAQGVSYRMDKLEDNGVVENYVTIINAPRLGYQHYKVFLKLHYTSPQVESNLINRLCDNQHVRWVVKLGGTYDVSFSLLATSPLHFRSLYQDIEAEFGRNILEKDVAVNVKSPRFARNYFLDEHEAETQAYEVTDEIVETDEVHRAILKDIAVDARKHIVDIASDTGESVDVVKYRLKQLQEKDVITGYSIQLNREVIGYEYYSVFFHMHNFTEQTERRVLRFAEHEPRVLFAVFVIGDHDLQLEVECGSYEQLQNLLDTFRQRFSEHVKQFSTQRVLTEYKYDFYPFNL